MALADEAAASHAAVPRPVVGRHDWPRAFKALRRLLADKDDTVQVFEIMRALNGPAAARGYRRLIATREGGRLAYERLELSRCDVRVAPDGKGAEGGGGEPGVEHGAVAGDGREAVTPG